MKLALIFEGAEEVPQRLVSDVLRTIDKRLFVYEKRALKSLKREFPQIQQRWLDQCRDELNRRYYAGEFSMLYIESVRTGSIEYLLVHGGYVVEFVVSFILLQATKDALKGVPAYEELVRRIRHAFIMTQETRLVKAVLDMTKKFNKTPVEVVHDDGAGLPLHRLRSLEMAPALAPTDYLPSLRQITEASPTAKKASKPLALPGHEPVERLAVKSPLIAHKPANGQHYLEARIERITVSVPPVTYARIVEDYNKGQ